MLLLLLACQEYTLNEKADPPLPDEDTAALIDTAPPEDTGETDTPEVTDEIPPGAAEAPVYANSATDLFEVDPATGDLVRIGAFHGATGPVVDFIDIAIDLEGRMYGGTFDALYHIDPETAAVSKVCATDVEMTALTFTAAGALIAGGDNAMVRMDVNTCGIQPLVADAPYVTSGDVVGLPDGYLYWTVRGLNGDDLVRVDPQSGALEEIGPVGHDSLFGLGYHEDQLYGFSELGVIVRISPDNGQAAVMVTGAPLWWGATTNPVRWD